MCANENLDVSVDKNSVKIFQSWFYQRKKYSKGLLKVRFTHKYQENGGKLWKILINKLGIDHFKEIGDYYEWLYIYIVEFSHQCTE